MGITVLSLFVARFSTEKCYSCYPRLDDPAKNLRHWIPISNQSHMRWSSSVSDTKYVGRDCVLPKEANDSSMIVDCGDYACWTFITVYSLFNNTDAVTKMDYDGDGDPDINPVGQIHRNCSRTLAKDAPDFDTRGTAWAALDQC